MAERRSGRKKKKGDGDQINLSKDENEVAKNLRFNLPTKKASMFGDQVVYFSGSSAIEYLLDSKWSKSSKSSIAFTDRESVVIFLQKMLDCGLFNRVHLIKTEKKVKDKKKDSGEKKTEEKLQSKSTDKTAPGSPHESKAKEEKGSKSDKVPGTPKAKKEGKEVKRVKKKVKIKLEIHEYQRFFDADDEYYVWIFDPISWKTFSLGILLVLGVVAICLFPLWPENIRDYSWYLSVAGAIFVGGILILAILRYIIHGMLWIGTMGKLHFWLLPNLTAECGFFESFVPAYEYTVYKKEQKEGDDESDKKQDSGSGNDVGAADKEEKQEKSQDNSEDSSKENSEWVKIKKGDIDEEPNENMENVTKS